MNKNLPRGGVSVPGEVEGERATPGELAKIGFMEFAARHEQLVREKNAEIESWKIQAEKAFSDYIGDRLKSLTTYAFARGITLGRWLIVIGFVFGVLLGWGVAHYVR
jgi:hypothetical protein